MLTVCHKRLAAVCGLFCPAIRMSWLPVRKAICYVVNIYRKRELLKILVSLFLSLDNVNLLAVPLIGQNKGPFFIQIL